MTEPEAWVEVAWYASNLGGLVAVLTFCYHALALKVRPPRQDDYSEDE